MDEDINWYERFLENTNLHLLLHNSLFLSPAACIMYLPLCALFSALYWMSAYPGTRSQRVTRGFTQVEHWVYGKAWAIPAFSVYTLSSALQHLWLLALPLLLFSPQTVFFNQSAVRTSTDASPTGRYEHTPHRFMCYVTSNMHVLFFLIDKLHQKKLI